MTRVVLRPVRELAPQVEGILARVTAQLGALLPDVEVHHIGATALPGVLTKGDVDVLVRVPSARFPAAVEELGRHFAVEQPANWTASFASFGDDGHELPLGIQVVAKGGEEDFFLYLRDYFLAHPDALREYDRLKEVHAPGGAEAYWRAKCEFLGAILDARDARDQSGDVHA